MCRSGAPNGQEAEVGDSVYDAGRMITFGQCLVGCVGAGGGDLVQDDLNDRR